MNQYEIEQRLNHLEFMVGELFRHFELPIPTNGPSPLEPVLRLMALGKKIEAIKVYREITGSSLRDAKNAVEAMPGGR